MRVCPAVLAFTLLVATQVQAQGTRLQSYNANLKETSVSGLSSGGYMAVQFHVAHSAFVKGAGVVAGGPYFCAKDDQNVATSVCSCTGLLGCQPSQAAQSVPDLIQRTNQFAQQGAIDPTSNLGASRVWLFAGTVDSVVPPPVMNALESYYKNYVSPPSNIAYRKDVRAEHAMPTDSFGNACDFRGDPFINNCKFDAAGDLLQWIYGALNPRAATLGGDFIEFDQSEFLPDPAGHGMSQTGWMYLPAACRQKAPCRVHVVFHGCKQYPGYSYAAGPQGKFGDTYVKNAGYNRWADTNNLIVLYPQANAMNVNTRLPRTNPNGCWDWWGYDDGAYATKSGRQMAAVRKMVERLAGATVPPDPPPPAGFCGSARNSEHAAADRAYVFFFWFYLARGSNDYLGLSGSTQTTLKQTGPGSYMKVSSCP